MSQKKSKSGDEPPPLPGMIPFTPKRKKSEKKQPADEIVDAQFTKLLDELDYARNKRNIFGAWTPAQKWEFILGHEAYERRVPSPDWIIRELADHFDTHFIISIGLALRTARTSWIDKFCDSGGHILLLRELAAYTAYWPLFANNYPHKKQVIMEILKTLKSVADCRNGAQQLLIFFRSIEILVMSIDIFNLPQFETTLYILLPYVFMDNGPELIVKSFEKLADVNNHKNAFRVFGDVIASDPVKYGKSVFWTFISGLYNSSQNNYISRLIFDFEYTDAGIVKVLKDLPSEVKEKMGMPLVNLLQTIETDMMEIKSLFAGELERTTSVDDLVKALREDRGFAVLLANLFSVKKNQNKELRHIYSFFAHFMQFLRDRLVHKNRLDKAILAACDYAVTQIENETLCPPNSSIFSKNIFYQLMREQFDYVSDDDLRFADAEGPNEKEIRELQKKLEDSRTGDRPSMAKMIQENDFSAVDGLSDVMSELAALRAQKAEFERMKADYDKLKKENEELVARETALDRFGSMKNLTVDIDELNFKPVTVETLIPKNSLNTNDLMSSMSAIRMKLAELCDAGSLKQDSELNILMKTVEIQLDEVNLSKEKISTNCQRFVETVTEEREKTVKELKAIEKIRQEVLEKSVTNTDVAETKAPVIRKDSKPLPKPVRPLVWTPVDATEWEELTDFEPNDDELMELFGVNDDLEAKLLTGKTSKAIRKIITNSRMDGRIITRCIDQEQMKLQSNDLSAILSIPFTVEETKKLGSADASAATTVEERFAIELLHISNYKEKVKRILQRLKFGEQIDEIAREVDAFSAVVTKLSESTRLKKILGIILAIGNRLNGGTPLGGAPAFAMDSLARLRMMKSNRKGFTFIHYLSAILDKLGENFIDEFEKELSGIANVTSTNLNELIVKLNTIIKQLADSDCSVKAYAALNEAERAKRVYNQISQSLSSSSDLLMTELADFVSELVKAARENRIAGNGIGDLKDKVPEPEPPKVDTNTPVKQDQLPKERGILDSMVQALNADNTPARRTGLRRGRIIPLPERKPTDFELAYEKVRGIVLY